MSTAEIEPGTVARAGRLSFVWLEITGLCQLECGHCYAASSPRGDHGSMTEADWRRVISDAAELDAGMVQFIGGEPTLHPALPELVGHALVRGLEVEVFSNLVRVTPALWQLFERPGVRLATSYYSDRACEHERITTRRGSHAKTRASIAEAVRRSIPLRVGVIDLADGQRADEAVAELRALGVTEIGVDRLREVGRGIRAAEASVDQLCGNCADSVLAVSPSGDVWPCVFSRWLPVGNVRRAPLADVVRGSALERTRGELTRSFAARTPAACVPSCVPDRSPTCNPTACSPHAHASGDCWPSDCNPKCGPSCGPACNPQCWPTRSGPCSPKGGCNPNYY